MIPILHMCVHENLFLLTILNDVFIGRSDALSPPVTHRPPAPAAHDDGAINSALL